MPNVGHVVLLVGQLPRLNTAPTISTVSTQTHIFCRYGMIRYRDFVSECGLTHIDMCRSVVTS